MKKILAALSVMAVMLFAVSCGEAGKTQVRLACFPNITHSQALVGMAQGSFEKAMGDDCDTVWLTFNAGPSEIEAMFAGEVDIGYIGPVPAINGYSKSGGDVRIIAGATGAGAILVTRKDLVLNDISELSGLKVAVPQYGNTQDLLLRDLLAGVGLKDKNSGGTVEILASENPNTKLLLDKGDVDAAFVPEPWGTRLINEIGANVLLEYDGMYDGGSYPTAVVIVDSKFMKEHPDKVEAFLREHVRLTDYINANKQEAAVLVNSQIEKITGSSLSEDVITGAFGRMIVTYDPYSEAVEKFTGIYSDLGYLTSQTDFSSLIDTTLLDKVLAE